MKNRIAAAVVASLLVGSLGATYAQGAQQTMPPHPAPPATSAHMQTPHMQTHEQSGQNMSSDKVEQKIKHALTSHGVTATHVTITFNDGTATLSGTVYNQRDISKAKRAAMGVRGVKRVDTSGLHARGRQVSQTQS